MEFFETVERRRSIRRYRDEPVPDELMDRIMEAARIAPSSSNTQSWKFKVVRDADTRKKLETAAFGQRFVGGAPIVIACCLDFDAFGEKGKRTRELVLKGAVRPSFGMMLRAARGGPEKDLEPERVMINGAVNVSIAAEHIVLAAVALGLGTCWVRAFDQPAVEKLLEIPEGVAVLALLTLGYPDESPAARPRKNIDEIML